MVYLNLQHQAPGLYVPLNGWPYGFGTLAFTIRNTTDRREVAVPITRAVANGFLVCLQVEVPQELTAGEWQYRLTANDGADLIATGLLVAYDGEKPGPVEYESEINVIQYE